MAIEYFEQAKVFKLDSKNTSYLMGVVDDGTFLGHIYYGSRISDHGLTSLLGIEEAPFVPSVNNRDRIVFYDVFPMEYGSHGTGDYRSSSYQVVTPSGHTTSQLYYKGYEIYAGKKGLAGLPATFGSETDCSSLEITCEDPILKLDVVLTYTVFEDTDVITRHTRFVNHSQETLYLNKAMSMAVDMDNEDFDMIGLHGSWARERHIERRRLGHGFQGVESRRGESGHQDHPFMALAASDATEDMGHVYGFSFVYSGNFIMTTELNQNNTVRVSVGINPTDFKWQLQGGDSFQTPEVMMTFSNKGIGQMSRNYHDQIRNHLIRGKYKDKKRPILINNWEATYFNFDADKLVAIAKGASEAGIEMLVMDDGWFGKRDDDNTGLGDWFVNEDKMGASLTSLVEQVNDLGMKFGIWFEPEMVSPDSDLYRAHPDWAIAVPGREGSLARNQFVLDFSRPEVVDYVFQMMADVLKSANIEYVKWDMNRPLSDLGSYSLSADCQGELSHRYMMGVYALQERLITEFPDLLLENCSGGGARFDPGMLYYSPQIWTSDDTDAIERLKIQAGTAMVYPLSAMGAHVSDCPNHLVGRTTPFETRGLVALAGTFGYELDITKISEADRAEIPGQIALYHQYNDLIRTGDYYRLASYPDNGYFDSWQVVAKDQSEVLVTYIQVIGKPAARGQKLKLKGLDPNKRYQISDTEAIYYGDTLMEAGYIVERIWGDFKGKLIHLKEVK